MLNFDFKIFGKIENRVRAILGSATPPSPPPHPMIAQDNQLIQSGIGTGSAQDT
jgi:hypothetical protein